MVRSRCRKSNSEGWMSWNRADRVRDADNWRMSSSFSGRRINVVQLSHTAPHSLSPFFTTLSRCHCHVALRTTEKCGICRVNDETRGYPRGWYSRGGWLFWKACLRENTWPRLWFQNTHSTERESSLSMLSIQCGRMYPSGPELTSNLMWKPFEWISGVSVTRNTDLNPMPFWPETRTSRYVTLSHSAKEIIEIIRIILMSRWLAAWLSA